MTCKLVDFSGEFFFTQWAPFAAGVGPGEEVFVWGNGVDVKVIFDSGERVSWTILLSTLY